HMEIRVSKSSVEVWASDAGDPSSFRIIAVATGITVPFTRGYVNFQQTHYNAHKCTGLLPNIPECSDCGEKSESDTGINMCPSLPPWANFQMDNVGFDGPVLPAPRSYQVQDNHAVSTHNYNDKVVVILPDGKQITTVMSPDPFVETGFKVTTDK